ncbi:hypothetical protein GWK08_09155 [Leptobacterium flavescens]|uniref:Histidine kinase n=1 Tax=Leptobacterium flavescens TaxID=472055 RepID=A0A6P0URV6_9FLAO|nr:hypothetical protein [Leptobacterium flavescens]NER13603.1 hypothetical protein [Leptobacterium flavescens]
MKSFIHKYKYIIIGAVISITGYLYSLKNNINLTDLAHKYLHFIEKYEVDLAFWVLILVFFVFLNLMSLQKKNSFAEKRKIYLSMLYASNHILRNLLNQIQIIRIEAGEDLNFDRETLKMFDESVEEAELLISRLSEVKNIDEDTIHESIKA